MDFAGSAHCLGRTLAQTKVLDLTGLLELNHGLDGCFDGLLAVESVAVVEVNAVDAEAAEGLVACLTDVGRLVVHGTGAVRGNVYCEFCGDEDLGAFSGFSEPSKAHTRRDQQAGQVYARSAQAENSPLERERNTYFPIRSSLSP